MLKPRLLLVAAALIALALVAAAPASAVQRYASPSGAGVEPCSGNTLATACPLETAVNGATGNDDVQLLGGPYTTSTHLGISGNVTVHGTPGSAPTLTMTLPSGNAGISLVGGGTLRDVRIEYTGDVAALLAQDGAPQVERVYAHTSSTLFACEAGQTSVFRDVVCWHSGPAVADAAGLVAYNTDTATATITLRNVTTVSSTSQGLTAQSDASHATNVVATNVIADGATVDVSRDVANGGTGSIALDHSNYASVTDPNNEITDAGTGSNQMAAPVFLSAGTGDFRQGSTSAGTIDMGTATGLLGGELDYFEGEARSQGAAPDIGADEITASAAPTLQPPLVEGDTSVSGTTSEAAGTTIEVFIDGVSAGTTTTAGSAWQVSSITPLATGQSVTAIAQAPGEGPSLPSSPSTVLARTATPVINAPILAGATSVSGTSTESDGTGVSISVNGTPVGTGAVVSGGTWTETGLVPLVAGDVVTATSQALAKADSFVSAPVVVAALPPIVTPTPSVTPTTPPVGTPAKKCKKKKKRRASAAKKCKRKKK